MRRRRIGRVCRGAAVSGRIGSRWRKSPAADDGAILGSCSVALSGPVFAVPTTGACPGGFRQRSFTSAGCGCGGRIVGRPAFRRKSERKNGDRFSSCLRFYVLPPCGVGLFGVRSDQMAAQLHAETRGEMLFVYQPVFPAVAPPASQPEERATRKTQGNRSRERRIEYVFQDAVFQPGSVLPSVSRLRSVPARGRILRTGSSST